MRRLALLPLLTLALGCSDSTVLQPEGDLAIAAAAAPRMVLTWQETFDQAYAGESWVTPSGVLQLRDADNGFFMAGDLVGYQRIRGRAMIDLRTGRGNGSGTTHADLTQPGVGTLDCTWHSKIYNFPNFVQYAEFSCKGTGYFEGWKVKGSTNNENNPGLGNYDASAEVR